jgi:hypothetical protein
MKFLFAIVVFMMLLDLGRAIQCNSGLIGGKVVKTDCGNNSCGTGLNKKDKSVLVGW